MRSEAQKDRERARSLRKRITRSATINPYRMSRKSLEELGAVDLEALAARPSRRADCEDGPRPCPWVSCRYHLYLDVGWCGTIKLNFPDLQPDELQVSCALDVADRGGETLEGVGALMNLTKERMRQIENTACAKLKESICNYR